MGVMVQLLNSQLLKNKLVIIRGFCQPFKNIFAKPWGGGPGLP
jgi:hypothetical protein